MPSSPHSPSFDPDNLESFSKKAQKERDKRAFEDFLAVPKISGKHPSAIHHARIPAEIVLDTGKVLEITYDDVVDAEEERNSLLLHRNEEGYIEQIDILCSCGRKYSIQLSDTESEEEND